MMHRMALAAGLFLVAVAVNPGHAATPEPPAATVSCDLPAELISPDVSLPLVAAALTKRHHVEILAIGSGSTVGDTTGIGGAAFVYQRPTSSFPFRMQEALQAMQPGASFGLAVKGGRNMTAEAMLPMLRQELAAHHYDLVVWQTGTVEAVRGLRPETMADVVQDGIEAAEAAGADVIMVDPQFSRFLSANTDLSPYQAALRQAVTVTGATLFRRFDLTHIWTKNGDIDLEEVGRDARDHTISVLNICLGRALAKFMLAGAEAPTH